MTVMAQEGQTAWREALEGEPFIRRELAPSAIADYEGWWWVSLAKYWPRPAPDPQIMIRELRQWTEWSSRQCAEMLGTSHTTVQGIERGRPLFRSRSGDLRQRILDMHDVVSRIYVLAGRDPHRTTDALLGGVPGEDRAVDHLRHGRPNAAYLAALDVLQPRVSRRNGLLVGDRPSQAGGATVPLND
jgi:hypothetical protein